MPIFKIKVSDQEISDIRKLRKSGNLKDNKDIAFTAFGLLYWAMKEIEAGKKIASVDKENNTFSEIKLFTK